MANDPALRRDPSGGMGLGVVDDSQDILHGVEGDATAKSVHVTMWRYNSSSLAWEKWDGKVDTIVSGDLIVAVDDLEQYILDQQKNYKLNDWKEVGNVYYLGYLTKDGAWYIKKVDLTNEQVRYIKGASGYDFSDPASLSYNNFDTVF